MFQQDLSARSVHHALNWRSVAHWTPINHFRQLAVLSLAISYGLLSGPAAFGQLKIDFDGGDNNAWSLTHSAGAAPALTTGGPTGSFIRLSPGTTNVDNSIATDENPTTTGPAPKGKVLMIDFRLSVEGTSQDLAGLGFGYAAVGPWGATGPRNPGAEDLAHDWDQPAYAGAVMVGLKVSPNSDLINLNAFGNQLAEVDVHSFLNLHNGLFHRAVLTVLPNQSDSTKAQFDLDIIEDVHGVAIAHNILSALPANINLSALPRNRVISGVVSRGLNVTADVDNLSVAFVPEPSLLTFSALVSAGLVIVRRRRGGERA